MAASRMLPIAARARNIGTEEPANLTLWDRTKWGLNRPSLVTGRIPPKLPADLGFRPNFLREDSKSAWPQLADSFETSSTNSPKSYRTKKLLTIKLVILADVTGVHGDQMRTGLRKLRLCLLYSLSLSLMFETTLKLVNIGWWAWWCRVIPSADDSSFYLLLSNYAGAAKIHTKGIIYSTSNRTSLEKRNNGRWERLHNNCWTFHF